MDEAMMPPTKERQIVETGGAVVCPEDDVMDVGVLRGAVATRGYTGAISRNDRPADPRRNSPNARPTSRIWLGPSVSTRDTEASQASIRACSAVIGPTHSNSAGPHSRSLRNVSRSMTTVR